MAECYYASGTPGTCLLIVPVLRLPPVVAPVADRSVKVRIEVIERAAYDKQRRLTDEYHQQICLKTGCYLHRAMPIGSVLVSYYYRATDVCLPCVRQ